MRLSGLLACLALAVVGCGPSEDAKRQFAQESARTNAPKAKTPPVPKTVAELSNLGLTAFKDSTLAEGEEGSSVRTNSIGTTYTLKMYAPALVDEVAGFYGKVVKEAIKSGSADFRRIVGKTERGHQVELMMSPTADKKRTLVMAWVTIEG